MTPEQELNYLKTASSVALCRYLASKIRQYRKLRKESQVSFAKRAGIPLRTFKRMETHGMGHLETFIKALQALEYSHYLQLLFPPQPASSIRTLEEKIDLLRRKQPLQRKISPN
ncbi:hypothetical protein VI06_21645 [Aquitalea magnusonii]|nr:hypothetical protein VI06_21645 [Aquitalea magnusonii]